MPRHILAATDSSPLRGMLLLLLLLLLLQLLRLTILALL
jgi:hypothetical protein